MAIRKPMVVDLMACFGDGAYLPSGTWCNENIPFTEDTVNLNIEDEYGVASASINPNPVGVSSAYLLSVESVQTGIHVVI